METRTDDRAGDAAADDPEAFDETEDEPTGDGLVLTGHLAVDLISEVELWRLRRGIGFESWSYCLTFEGRSNAGTPHYRSIEVLRLLYRAHVAYGRAGRWRKPFRGDLYHVTAATVGARLNLKKETAQGVLRQLKAKGYIRQEMRQGRYPHYTPDPIRIAEITFPVESKADEHGRVFPLLHFDDSALHHLTELRPAEVGAWTGDQPINPYVNGEVIQARALAQALPELPARAAAPAEGDQDPPALPATPSGWSPSRQEVLGPDNWDDAEGDVPPDSGRGGGPPAVRRVEDGTDEEHQPDGGAFSVRDQSGDEERVEDAVLLSTMVPLDAISALIFGWEGTDFGEDELGRIADQLLFKHRSPLDEASYAHSFVMGECGVDPDRGRRVGVAPEVEAAAVRHEVYRRARARLEEDLVAYYERQRREKPMNRALLSVIAYFRTHFGGEERDIKDLARIVNLLVGKLRDRCLADSVADEVGVDPFYSGYNGDHWLIHPDVKEAMGREHTRWERDEGIGALKETWARERIVELVRLVFNDEGDDKSPQSVRDLYLERANVPSSGLYATRERELLGIRWSLRDEYMMNPELLDVWPHLGLRQLGRFGGVAHYESR